MNDVREQTIAAFIFSLPENLILDRGETELIPCALRHII